MWQGEGQVMTEVGFAMGSSHPGFKFSAVKELLLNLFHMKNGCVLLAAAQ